MVLFRSHRQIMKANVEELPLVRGLAPWRSPAASLRRRGVSLWPGRGGSGRRSSFPCRKAGGERASVHAERAGQQLRGGEHDARSID